MREIGFFLLSQDQKYRNPPVIEDFYQRMRRKDFTVELADKIPDRNVVYCDTNRKQDFLDVLDQQVLLVSREVKEVFQMYQRDINYKYFCCLNNVTGEYKNYYAPILPFLNCIAGQGARGNREELKLVRNKIGDAGIFRIPFYENGLTVIRLDVAESLLRRKLKGIELKRTKSQLKILFLRHNNTSTAERKDRLGGEGKWHLSVHLMYLAPI